MSQVSIIDIEGNNPQIPTRFNANVGFAVPIGNILEIRSAVVAAGSVPTQTVGSGNTITTNIQTSQAIASTDATKIGLASFNSADFSVDANGFVSSISSGGGIGSISGDSGSITGSSVTIYANNAANVSGASVSFINSGTVSTLQLTATGANTHLGESSGNLTESGTGNTSVGQGSLAAVTTASDCLCLGFAAGSVISTGFRNTFIGSQAGVRATTSIINVGLGYGALQFIDTGNGANTAIGNASLEALTTGMLNVGLGSSSGANYTSSESSNICIENRGTVGESNTIRIGTQGSSGGQQNRFFAAGVVGVTTSNSQMVTIDSTTGQLGVAAITTGTISGLIPNSGTSPVVPDGSGQVTIQGTGSITTVGALNSLTPQLTGLTNHAVLVGAGTATITKVGPSATSGQVFQSAGSSADPSFSTATYPSTATGTGTILRANGTNWLATTATYPNTTTINQLLYSSAANTIGGITASANGVLISSNTNVPSWLANGTAGQVLKANTGAPPSWQTDAGVITINGDSGSVTGSTITFTGGTSGAVFTGSSATMTESFNFLALPATDNSGNGVIKINSVVQLNAIGTGNLFLGNGSGNTTTTATYNTGVGYQTLASVTTGGGGNVAMGYQALKAMTSGTNNVAIGPLCGTLLNTGTDNVAVGNLALTSSTTSTYNVAIGFSALQFLQTGVGGNVSLGYQSLQNITTGTNNVSIGTTAGQSLTTSNSSNILIMSTGVSGDNNTMRLGTDGSSSGNVNKAYVGGVRGVAALSNSAPVGIDNNFQLCNLGQGTSGQVFTSNGAGVTPTFQTAASRTKITTYNASGSWTIDPNAKEVEVYMWSGGSGGGSGRSGATTLAGGGGGGAPANFLYTKCLASTLTSSPYTVTIGAGGTGGTSVSAAITNGNPGNPGGTTSIGTALIVPGPTGGTGGTTTAAGSAVGSFYNLSGTAVATAQGGQGTATSGNGVSNAVFGWATGGAGGPGYTAATTRTGNSGGLIVNLAGTTLASGGTGGANTGGAGGAGNTLAGPYVISGGTGGGAGGQDGNIVSGAGGAGAQPGGGGGGGAGSLSGSASGAGGNGGDGRIIIIEYL